MILFRKNAEKRIKKVCNYLVDMLHEAIINLNIQKAENLKQSTIQF